MKVAVFELLPRQQRKLAEKLADLKDVTLVFISKDRPAYAYGAAFAVIPTQWSSHENRDRLKSAGVPMIRVGSGGLGAIEREIRKGVALRTPA